MTLSRLHVLWLPAFALALVAALGIAWTAAANATAPQQLINYQNEDWHFSINIPAELTVLNKETQGDAEIIQLSDPKADHSIQIMAMPYRQMDVALGEEGVPSDASDQSNTLGVVNVFRDGAYSVAFHHNGIAYTITTTTDDETWLLPILQSWWFLE
jgi:hypothetical protein